MTNKQPLFVYGTLHPDRAPEEIRAAVAHFHLIGQGTVTGQLLNLGEYPGVITTGAQNPIPGTIFAVPGDPTIWHALDTYEGFDPDNLAASLFRREQITVTMEDGTQRQCWIYLYNHPQATEPGAPPSRS
jgi:gamma-glutamylcyclotransferase (GGCT)/AIG2-like uncharacterized protein YtfP